MISCVFERGVTSTVGMVERLVWGENPRSPIRIRVAIRHHPKNNPGHFQSRVAQANHGHSRQRQPIYDERPPAIRECRAFFVPAEVDMHVRYRHYAAKAEPSHPLVCCHDTETCVCGGGVDVACDPQSRYQSNEGSEAPLRAANVTETETGMEME